MQITIPTSWADVTVRQFQKLSEIPSLEFDDIDKQLRILEVLTGVSDDTFLNMKFPDLKKLIKKIDFINYTPTGKKRPVFIKVKGRRFHINYIPQELRAGEYIDLTELTKEKINENIAKIMAVYFKPVNILGFQKRGCYEKGIQTSESRKWTEQAILDNLTMDNVFPISGFFLQHYQNLTKATLDYLEKTMKTQKKKIREQSDLLKSGAGS